MFTEELLGAIRAGSAELPPTLRDLLRGRVQALPESARHVLEVVAVAGRRVPHRLVAAVAGLEDQRLVQALRTAVADQLLVIRPDQDGYELRHALLAEVIEADLLPGERARHTPPTPARSPSGQNWPMPHRRWPRPRWPPTGTHAEQVWSAMRR